MVSDGWQEGSKRHRKVLTGGMVCTPGLFACTDLARNVVVGLPGGLFAHCDHVAVFLLIATMEGRCLAREAGSRRGAWPATCSTTVQFRGFDDVNYQADLIAPPTAVPL